MPTVPLPERPNLEQLKKQAKLLLRAVRAGDQRAVSMVAEHHRDTASAFSLDSAQFVLARSYGFASWAKLRQHVVALAPQPEPRQGVVRILTVEDRYHAQPGRAADEDIRRAAGRYPELAAWRPLLTVHHNRVKAIAFATPDGPRFCELTPTAITLSEPVPPGPGRATLTFHTALGTLAGAVEPEVRTLSLERPTDLRANERAVLADGVFVVPNAFPVNAAGLVFRFDNARTGDIVPAAELTGRAVTVVDRPAPAADRDSPAGRRLAAAIARADAPPVVDPDQWVPGVHLTLTDAERLQLGRYGDLLGWHRTGPGEDDGLTVFDFGPQQGPLQPFAVIGTTITATRMYYDFQHGSSDTVALVGLVDDDRVASITLRRNGEPDVAAVVDGGTYAIPGLVGLSESGAGGARLTVRDGAGNVLEDLPYRRDY